MPTNTSTNKKIGIIVASVRPGRNADKILEWFLPLTKKFVVPAAARQELAAGAGLTSGVGAMPANNTGGAVTFEVIDLKEWNLPFADEPGYPSAGKNYIQEHTRKWSAKIDECSGFIILANEYNHGYSAALKNALDYLYLEWNNKPVSFVSYGGAAGGARSVEQLRQVAIELQMIPLREQLTIPLGEFFVAFGADGKKTPAGEASFKRWEDQAGKVIGQIVARV